MKSATAACFTFVPTSASAFSRFLRFGIKYIIRCLPRRVDEIGRHSDDLVIDIRADKRFKA